MASSSRRGLGGEPGSWRVCVVEGLHAPFGTLFFLLRLSHKKRTDWFSERVDGTEGLGHGHAGSLSAKAWHGGRSAKSIRPAAERRQGRSFAVRLARAGSRSACDPSPQELISVRSGGRIALRLVDHDVGAEIVLQLLVERRVVAFLERFLDRLDAINRNGKVTDGVARLDHRQGGE